MIDLRVLGTLAIHRSGEQTPVALTQPKRLALLLYLTLAEPAGATSRDTLLALLWPDADAESARHALRNALHGLREMLGETAIVSRGNGYVGLDPTVVRCDALEIRRLLADRQWEDAVAAWHGNLAPGFNVSGAPEFERWLDGQRTALRGAVTEAAWHRVKELERSGDAGLVAAARRAWALDPADEAGAMRLMQYLDTAVGRNAALRVYDELAEHLRREYDAAPSPETRAFAAELKARIELPRSRATPALPVAEEPGTPQTGSFGAAPSAPPTRRRHVARAGALIAAAIVTAGIVSVLGRRSTVSAAPGGGADPVAEATRAGTLRLAPKYREDTSAYSSYLRGLALRISGRESTSRDTFAALVNRRPLYAPGLSGLAHAAALATVYGELPPAEGWPKVEAAAHRAIALDSTSASAYLALGAMEMFWRWDLPRARQLIDRGLALEPRDPEAHAVRGAWFRWHGEMDSAVAEARTSYLLDPLEPSWAGRLARQLTMARRYPEAEAMYRQMMRDYPQKSGSYHGMAGLYRTMGRMRDALAMRRTGLEIEGDSAAADQLPIAPSEGDAARALAEMSRKELRDLTAAARKGEWVAPNAYAFAYAELRDTNETLRWLDSMRAGRDPLIHTVPLGQVFDFLRDVPRYQAWEASLPWREASVPRTDPITPRR
jgi:DNA-binding SARP family transcriptional activator